MNDNSNILLDFRVRYFSLPRDCNNNRCRRHCACSDGIHFPFQPLHRRSDDKFSKKIATAAFIAPLARQPIGVHHIFYQGSIIGVYDYYYVYLRAYLLIIIIFWLRLQAAHGRIRLVVDAFYSSGLCSVCACVWGGGGLPTSTVLICTITPCRR